MATFIHYHNSLANQKVRRRYVRYCKYIQLLHIAGSVVLFGLAGALTWICMAIF